MKKSKVNKEDTSRIFEVYSNLRDSILSDKDLSDNEYKLKYEQNILELDNLFKLKKKEEKGEMVFTIIISVIMLAVIMFGLITYAKLADLKDRSATLENIMNPTLDSPNSESGISYMVRDGVTLKYWTLVNENDSLINRLNKLSLEMDTSKIHHQNKITMQKLEIDLIKSNYNIELRKTNRNNTISYSLYAPKLDSALILLEVYRNKLHYNPDDQTWYIK